MHIERLRASSDTTILHTEDRYGKELGAEGFNRSADNGQAIGNGFHALALGGMIFQDP